MAGLLDPLGVLGTRHKPVRDYVWTAGLTAVLMLFLSFVLPVSAWMVFLVPLIILNPALIRCHGLLNVCDAQAGLGQIFIGFVTVGLVAFAAMILDGQLSHVPPRFLETRPTIAAMPKMQGIGLGGCGSLAGAQRRSHRAPSPARRPDSGWPGNPGRSLEFLEYPRQAR